MNYRIRENSSKAFLIELKLNTFRTRIEFNYTPPENFSGIAVACNYNFRGHPIGFIKDNGLVKRQFDGHRHRSLFYKYDTCIQAGPALIKDSKACGHKDFVKESFSTHYIVGGFHSHIGRKKSGNIIIGCTYEDSLVKIIKRYKKIHATEAIKLPGLSQASFYCNIKQYTLKEGVFPIPVALVFETRLNFASKKII